MHRAGWTFFTTLKRNRLVRRSSETGYQSLGSLDPPAEGWRTGLEVRLRAVLFGVKRFKLVTTNGDI